MSHQVTPGPIPGSGAHTMQAAYLGGSTVDITAAELTVSNTQPNSTGALIVDKSPSGGPQTGDALVVIVGANSSGIPVNIQHSGSGPTAITWDNGQLVMPAGGNASAPDIAVSGSPGTGVYSASVDTLYIATGGTEVCRFVSGGAQQFATNGTAGAPVVSSTAATTTGAYFPSVGEFGVTTTGTEAVRWNASQQTLVPDGTAALPSYAFANFAGHGMRAQANNIGISVSGAEILRVSGGGVGVQSLNLGTAANPAFNATADPNTGIYWPVAANEFAVSTDGTEAVRWNTAQQTLVPDGLVGTPSYAFASSTGTGIMLAGSGLMAFVRNGAEVFRTLGSFTGIGFTNAGTEAQPRIVRTSDVDTGIFWVNPDIFAISTGATEAVRWNASQQTLVPDGTNSLPSYAFATDTDFGWFLDGAGVMGLGRGGVTMFQVGAAGSSAIRSGGGGTAGVPIFSFTNDPNSGMYSFGTDAIAISAGGNAVAVFADSGICLDLTEVLQASGSPTALRIRVADHNTLAAGAEAIGVEINLGTDVQFATGAKTNQRGMVIRGPGYSAVAATVITNAATLAIQGPPTNFGNITFTNGPFALWIQAGLTQLDGGCAVTGDITASGDLDAAGGFRSHTHFTRIVLVASSRDMYRDAFRIAVDNTYHLCERAGSVVGIAASGDSVDVTAGTMGFRVRKSTDGGDTFSDLWGTIATGAVTLAVGPGAERVSATAAKDTFTFAVGDILNVRYEASAAFAGPAWVHSKLTVES